MMLCHNCLSSRMQLGNNIRSSLHCHGVLLRCILPIDGKIEPWLFFLVGEGPGGVRSKLEVGGRFPHAAHVFSHEEGADGGLETEVERRRTIFWDCRRPSSTRDWICASEHLLVLHPSIGGSGARLPSILYPSSWRPTSQAPY